MSGMTPYTRTSRRTMDLRIVQAAAPTILELIESLDRRLLNEHRASDRLRMLRDTTNQVTRTANDAIQAYRRATGAVRTELAKPTGDHAQALQTRTLLRNARAELLRVLEVTSRRYAWAEARPADAVGPSAAIVEELGEAAGHED